MKLAFNRLRLRAPKRFIGCCCNRFRRPTLDPLSRRGVATLHQNADTDRTRFTPADEQVREEIGGILERAFKREGGTEPNEQEIHRFLILADEAEKRAEACEHLAHQASEAARIASQEPASSKSEGARELVRLRESEAEQYSLEAETWRTDVERLRSYLQMHKL
jgi:hypothetical protein